MKFPRALRRLLLGYFVIHLLAAGFFVAVLARVVRNQMMRDTQARMSAMTTMLVEHVGELDDGLSDSSLLPHVKSLGKQTGMRFTLITAEGLVVADSITGIQDIGPHENRQEILSAKDHGFGVSERYSSTLNKQMMYFARRIEPNAADEASSNGGFVRIAAELDSINETIHSIQFYVWICAISLGGLTAFLMAVFSAQSMRPLSLFSALANRVGKGQYDQFPKLRFRNDEWGELSEAFQQMQSELTSREIRLTQNSQRLEAVLSSMIEGVIAIDPDGVVMLANGAACEMFSLTRPGLIGRKLLEIVRIPELTEAIAAIRQDQIFLSTEFKTLTDPQRTLKARVSRLANENESGVAIILHDVTELRQLETMRRDFVANVSHELKTPLASIKAYAETLRLGAINDQEKNLSFVENIEFQAELLNSQIQDLLQLARVESGATAFCIADVDVNLVCESCYQQFKDIAADSKLTLVRDFSESEPLARCDTDALATIANNLVVNAIHYTLEGGTVTISTRRDGDWALLSVIDDGIGIAPDQQSRVFERFFRVDKARSRDMGGTGLGLAIVKHLTQAFGGNVELTSKLGKGSTFEVRIPRPESASRPDEVQAKSNPVD